MERKTVRGALAAIAAAAVLLTACGQPPADHEPVAVPAPVAVTTEPQPEPIESAVAEPTEEPAEAQEPQESPTPTEPPAEQKPTKQPAPQAGPAIMKQGDQSDRVKELQARLKQIGWFSARVTGYYGTTTRSSVAGFQAKRGLPSNGAVDQATWNKLTGMTRKPTAAELADEPPATAPPANNSAAGGARKAQGLDPRCMTGARVICVSKRSNKVWLVRDGVVAMTMDARFGTTEYRTREGTFSVQWKSRDHVSNLYHTSMPYALFFSGGQALHFSPDFAANGYNGGSHGCVNLRDRAGAQALFNAARVGDKVVVYS